ncbi:MAG: DUF2442 domain-containing protein [Alphaproteobacteria bacterium]|nr:DUF2442 domain-containing protein [Alphaproteobacteria bacterium]
MVSRKAFKDATARAEERRAEGPTAVAARYIRATRRISVTLDTDIEVIFSADRAQGLAQARPADLSDIEITPSGLGLHFPKLDADIYLPALLEGVLGSRSWMAASLGKKGGSSRSRAKATASRNNGKLGGRPRKAGDRKTRMRIAG